MSDDRALVAPSPRPPTAPVALARMETLALRKLITGRSRERRLSGRLGRASGANLQDQLRHAVGRHTEHR